jgi:hypothetical protein
MGYIAPSEAAKTPRVADLARPKMNVDAHALL